MSPATRQRGVGALENQVSEIIFLATGGSESGGAKP